MADDIDEHTRYVADFATPASLEPRLKDRTLTINGVSKAYSMTGWRIGDAAAPQWLIDAMQVLQSQSTSNASSISQAAAVAALDGGTAFIQDWLVQLGERHDRVLQTLDRIDGLHSASPEGAFYVFASCAGPLGRRLETDLDVANYLLDGAHVGTVHGSAFGAPGYVRIAYAVDMTVLDEACRRIEAACAALSPRQASPAGEALSRRTKGGPAAARPRPGLLAAPPAPFRPCIRGSGRAWAHPFRACENVALCFWQTPPPPAH